MRGAGGTNGGIVQFLLGLIMLGVGCYLFLEAITVSSNFHMGYAVYSTRNMMGMGWNMSLTSGAIMVPMMFGIGMIFYNRKNIFGWLLALGALAGVIFGVIMSLKFQMRPMSAFTLTTIVFLIAAGLGMFLSSLKEKTSIQLDKL